MSRSHPATTRSAISSAASSLTPTRTPVPSARDEAIETMAPDAKGCFQTQVGLATRTTWTAAVMFSSRNR